MGYIGTQEELALMLERLAQAALNTTTTTQRAAMLCKREAFAYNDAARIVRQTKIFPAQSPEVISFPVTYCQRCRQDVPPLADKGDLLCPFCKLAL